MTLGYEITANSYDNGFGQSTQWKNSFVFWVSKQILMKIYTLNHCGKGVLLTSCKH